MGSLGGDRQSGRHRDPIESLEQVRIGGEEFPQIAGLAAAADDSDPGATLRHPVFGGEKSPQSLPVQGVTTVGQQNRRACRGLQDLRPLPRRG